MASSDKTITDNLDGKYEILDHIGDGGMGEVLLARHVLLNQRRALKKIKAEFSKNPQYKRRFFREAQAAGIVNHPNLCAVHDLVDHPRDGLFMVMEYLDGISLREKLKNEGSHSPQKVIEVLEPVARALDAAHASGVIHRDVKPANIMVGVSNGIPFTKLLDLGIAKLQPKPGEEPDTALTRLGQMMGTFPYISPEQLGIPQDDGKLDGEGNIEIDGRADIYSLGVVAYELISAHKPFQANHASTLIHQITKMKPNSLHDSNRNVPVAFDQAVQKAMSVDRKDRQRTCEEFINDLKAALGIAEVSWNRRKLIWLLVPLLFLLMAFATWIGCRWCSTQPIAVPCPSPVATPSPSPSFEGRPTVTKKGTFNIVVFNEGYNWRLGSASVVQRNGVDLPNGITTELYSDEMQKEMGTASEIVCLGTASIEAPVGLEKEEDRAKRRASQLAAWISETGKFSQPIFTLNLGKFAGLESSPETQTQRRIVIVGVLNKTTDQPITGDDIRDAVRQYQAENGGRFPIAFDNYSLTAGGKVITLQPYVPTKR